jgi:hypothetical protein
VGKLQNRKRSLDIHSNNLDLLRQADHREANPILSSPENYSRYKKGVHSNANVMNLHLR